MSLWEIVQRFRSFTGCALREAVWTASRNPARVLGLDDRLGSIAAGRDADLFLVDALSQPRLTLVAGRIVFDGR